MRQNALERGDDPFRTTDRIGIHMRIIQTHLRDCLGFNRMADEVDFLGSDPEPSSPPALAAREKLAQSLVPCKE